ncbi:cytochrome P450 [Glonium stellatum]|uniref:Cytochrome P450 n=1 Tax=Glonium stellatum TaxID=574774 RepID=A0A8E2JZ90_9PEZI|nr:cytochrome P450 [Glonium stellatum]
MLAATLRYSVAGYNTHPLLLLLALLGFTVFFYVIYYRFAHPLSKYPGPYLACLTNWWKVYHTFRLDLHEAVLLLHEKYGSVVRIGPNDLHFWGPEALAPIYKAGRSMPKTEFYDSFTTFNPNLFGTTDDDQHALRRRQLSHGFSMISAREMEPIIDYHMGILRKKLDQCAKTGQVFDLKEYLGACILDGLGEMAFARSFDSQSTESPAVSNAIRDHILLACSIGQLPLQSLTKAAIAWSPIPWIRRLIQSRQQLKQQCAECVDYRISHPSDRKDLLHSLIKAKDPDTGAELTRLDINTEAFAMLVAGSHSTTGTLGMLFYNLFRNPAALREVTAEIDSHLLMLNPDQPSYSFDNLESMEHVVACVRENFRMDPVFTMTLWRRVTNPDGVQIGDNLIPQGTNVCIMNYVLHHNPDIWGKDQNTYNPSRWLDPEAKNNSPYLIPFSIGHRMCIGRNVATMEIYKMVTTLLRNYRFAPVFPGKKQSLRSSGIGELEGELLVRVSKRGNDSG